MVDSNTPTDRQEVPSSSSSGRFLQVPESPLDSGISNRITGYFPLPPNHHLLQRSRTSPGMSNCNADYIPVHRIESELETSGIGGSQIHNSCSGKETDVANMETATTTLKEVNAFLHHVLLYNSLSRPLPIPNRFLAPHTFYDFVSELGPGGTISWVPGTGGDVAPDVQLVLDGSYGTEGEDVFWTYDVDAAKGTGDILVPGLKGGKGVKVKGAFLKVL